MIDKNTWPDFSKNSLWVQSSINNETIKRLEGIWVEKKTAIKLAELRWDIWDNEIKNTLGESHTQEEIQKRFSEVKQVLDEHKQNISEDIAAKAMSERIKLWESITSTWKKSTEAQNFSSWNALLQSVKTLWTFWKDFIRWTKDLFLQPVASAKYVYNRADWVLDESDLNYTIT